MCKYCTAGSEEQLRMVGGSAPQARQAVGKQSDSVCGHRPRGCPADPSFARGLPCIPRPGLLCKGLRQLIPLHGPRRWQRPPTPAPGDVCKAPVLGRPELTGWAGKFWTGQGSAAACPKPRSEPAAHPSPARRLPPPARGAAGWDCPPDRLRDRRAPLRPGRERRRPTAMGSGSSRRRGPEGRAGQSREPPGPEGRAGQSREPPGPEGRAGQSREPPADGQGAAAPPGPGRRAPAAGGSSAEAAGGGAAPLQQAALSTRSPPDPENNNLDHQCPESNKKPLGQSTILYDYSEEELMASIEREYCR
ncbi:cystin-1 [Parus major]|uniref:cystin-1 n=1 Tax=Parus major TaxID=9157 RepID=UPI0014444710|nr:cystin-1 [Parus major]